ncbi:hypothetical protein OPV22_008475 [Ensete ventricosum]|uniref:DUF4378 domain-containing protein n=1 Tax=Ensete ventricosum TaxID=4639 RepID=A0AAV8RGL9_ENSVE|nr:hypothetical protein OPV22_008475 [Ensete ventricosum]
MMPGVVGHAAVEERRIERQMGCMAGFLQLFDRHHIPTGKRHFATRHLPTTPLAESTAPSETSDAPWPSFFKASHPSPSSPEPCPSSPESRFPVDTPTRLSHPLPLPVFEVKDGVMSSWKLRDIPRFSLDSRAVVDGKGKLGLGPLEIRTAVRVASAIQSDSSEVAEHRRSPSVVARLIGVETLPSTGGVAEAEPERGALRRSASESRVPRDAPYSSFVEACSFREPSPQPLVAVPNSAEVFFKTANLDHVRLSDAKKLLSAPRPIPLTSLQRRSFFDVEDFFPEPKRSGMLYGEIEKRLRMRGIDEPTKDLETLKQILEALQMKGLLHSKPSAHRTNGRINLIYDFQVGAPVVMMNTASKPPRFPPSEPPPPPKSSAGCHSASPVWRKPAMVGRSIITNERTVQRSPSNAAVKKNPHPQRWISTARSPTSSPKRAGPELLGIGSPRSRTPRVAASHKEPVHPLAEDNTSTTISESSISASSPSGLEGSRAEHKSGRSLVERCDKLLHSITAFAGADQVAAVDQQPSPVSVLDSSSFLGEGVSPSPLAKRSIDFKDQTADGWEEQWSSAAWRNHGDRIDGPGEVDHDYAYVCDVLRVSDRNGEASDAVYTILEKRCCRHRGASSAARLHRRLLFDAVAEILERSRRVCPWEAFSRAGPPPADGGEEVVRQVWTEVRRIREQMAADDQDGAACAAVRKDMTARHAEGWSLPAVEISDAVLLIERLIFKDLVVETIRALADAGNESRPLLSRRKLLF